MVSHLCQEGITVTRSTAVVMHKKIDKYQLEMLIPMQLELLTVAWCRSSSCSNSHTTLWITTAVTTMEMILWSPIKKTNQLAWRVHTKLMTTNSFVDQSSKCSSSSINIINPNKTQHFLNNTVRFMSTICKAKMMISSVSTTKKLLLLKSSGKLLNSGITNRSKRTSRECRNR